MKPNTFKFFLVDDDPFCATAYQQCLKNLNYNDIIHFNNGEDCLDNLYLNPDIIFLDYNMDNLNGLDVLKKIKRYNPNIFVVIISAQDNISNAIEIMKNGAFDYLLKDNTVCIKMNIVIDKIKTIQDIISKKKESRIFKFISLF